MEELKKMQETYMTEAKRLQEEVNDLEQDLESENMAALSIPSSTLEELRYIGLVIAGQKLNFYFRGLLFTSHLLTKSATLNRLLHCSLWQFLRAPFFIFEGFFLHFGAKSPGAPVELFPWYIELLN